MSFEDGPFVQAACFCETVIEGNDGVLSLIRIIDRVTTTASGSNPPENMPPISYELKLVLMLKAGNARGRSDLKIVIEEPSGISKTLVSRSVHFDGSGIMGQNIVTQIVYNFEQEGLYWFWIELDDERLTGLPFQIQYSRLMPTMR